jgi:3-hydroxyisobutyrate dehydrogenase-like beta-hydroxyacid dehydrogenase
MESAMSDTTLALIGFGEVGQTLARDLRRSGCTLTAYDKLFADPDSPPSRAAAGDSGVRPCTTLAEALAPAQIVISAVTAAECVAAAFDAAPALHAGAYWLDLNSVSPSTKTAAARLIDSAGARFVEAAVMSPIAPKGIASPMLLGGPHAGAFAPIAVELGFAGVEHFADSLGTASAAKMCRSVMIKGMEALLTESLLAARHYGVESTVLESLRNLFPGEDWQAVSRYMISRSLQHGRRRAEEMREVARTVGDAGLEPWMSTACAERQDWAAGYDAARTTPSLEMMLDAVLAAGRVRK